MISVLIPTKNEQQDLPGCLKSLTWCDDVHVYDSGSTDATVDVARAAGARVTVSPISSGDQIFGGNEAAHKAWALHNIPFKYPWVLHLDADERPTPELIEAALLAVRNPGTFAGFRVRRRDFLNGRWLRHAQNTHLYTRLFRPEKLRYERVINPVSVIDGSVGELPGYLDHYPFSKGMAHWLSRHNSYSSLEAEQIVSRKNSTLGLNIRKALSAKDFGERRVHQKQLFYRLPARPVLKFLLLYLAKGGILDGRAGLTYAILQAIYEYMIVAKTEELRSRNPETNSNTAPDSGVATSAPLLSSPTNARPCLTSAPVPVPEALQRR
jgi:glycosyltransferase involved in cell wall biosynthesis